MTRSGTRTISPKPRNPKQEKVQTEKLNEEAIEEIERIVKRGNDAEVEKTTKHSA